jgi:phosphomannomutase/phosphoglucomutase
MKVDIDTTIFRAYDIRGIYPDNMNENMAFIFGKSFGTYVTKMGKKEVLVGYDNRLSSPNLSESLKKGLISTGVNVTDLGLVTTPMFYFARYHLNIWSGIMITASHNPKEYNGFKISFDERGNAVGDEIAAFRDFTMAGNFIDGVGSIKEYSVKDEYVNTIIKSLNLGPKNVKIVFDCGNGTGSVIIRDILDKLPLEYSLLFAESDGTFPNHHPDPSVSKNLIALQAKVKELHYDLGIAIDADADRVRLVDELGNIINSDIYLIIMYRYLNEQLKNRTAIYDVKCSQALIEELDKLGLKKIMLRTGNSYSYRKIDEMNIDFGGEYSGHFFFRDKFPGFDDGIYAGLRMVEILSHTYKVISSLSSDVKHYFSTDEIKIAVTEETKFLIIEELKKYLTSHNYNYLTIDGVRVEFDDAWFLVRASNTGPDLTLRFEATTENRLNEIKEEYLNLINEIIKKINQF